MYVFEVTDYVGEGRSLNGCELPTPLEQKVQDVIVTKNMPDLKLPTRAHAFFRLGSNKSLHSLVKAQHNCCTIIIRAAKYTTINTKELRHSQQKL